MTESIRQALNGYIPYNQQEVADKEIMLQLLENAGDIFTRENMKAHFTASSWIVNETGNKTLMVYHNIYNSWSWTGGHADGETDLLAVALKEAREETGLDDVKAVLDDIFSIEIITVDGHEKKGKYVPSHLHLNVTYLLQADESDVIRIKPDENSGVKWFELEKALEASTEPWMVQRVYSKLIDKLSKGAQKDGI